MDERCAAFQKKEEKGRQGAAIIFIKPFWLVNDSQYANNTYKCLAEYEYSNSGIYRATLLNRVGVDQLA